MEGRTGTGNDGKKTNLTNNYKGYEVVESYDHQRPKEKWDTEEIK